jgi:hypothetical protein
MKYARATRELLHVNVLWGRWAPAEVLGVSHAAHPCRQSAITSKRDVKKALQQLGRTRADILLCLPKPLIIKLAAVSLSPSEAAERKTSNAYARLNSAAAAAAAMAAEDAATASMGSASTQDLLRVLWAACNSPEADSNAGEAAVRALALCCCCSAMHRDGGGMCRCTA